MRVGAKWRVQSIALHELVELMFVVVRAAADAPENAAGDARFQVGAVREVEPARERHAAVRHRDLHPAERGQLGGEHVLEAPRARREVAFSGFWRGEPRQNGLATTR